MFGNTPWLSFQHIKTEDDTLGDVTRRQLGVAMSSVGSWCVSEGGSTLALGGVLTAVSRSGRGHCWREGETSSEGACRKKASSSTITVTVMVALGALFSVPSSVPAVQNS